MKKNVRSTRYHLDEKQLTAVLTHDDDTKKFIFVQRGMIFVADYDYAELTRRINDDDIDSYEAYDTIDGRDYYMRSDYASDISCALLYLVNSLL